MQFDLIKMKKNLDDNKKRLAEKTSAADALQKSLGKTKGEKAELEKTATKNLDSDLYAGRRILRSHDVRKAAFTA